jgi:hypothetical protein
MFKVELVAAVVVTEYPVNDSALTFVQFAPLSLLICQLYERVALPVATTVKLVLFP